MKRNIYLLLLLALVPASNAQVINGDFENVKTNGKVSNWGINFSIPVAIDLGTGENVSDEILFGNSSDFSCTPTSDYYSGSKALEINNAYNLTQNHVIPGGAVLFHDATQDCPGWNPGVPVAPGMNVSVLSFHYKYIPFGVTDVIEAELTVLGESGEIGRASIQIAEPDYVYDGNAQFKYAEAPVTYSSNETPLWMYISFSMGTAANATFGSKIIIDDVRVNNGALSTTQVLKSNFSIFPTVTSQLLNVVLEKNNNDRVFNFSIYAIDGKLVREESVAFNGNSTITIDVSPLTKGIYFLRSKNGTAKFIRE